MPKRRRPVTPVQIRRERVFTEPPSDKNWDDAEARRTLEPYQIAVGVVQHQMTNNWHAWLSLYGTDLMSVGVYATEKAAWNVATAIGAVFRNWDDSNHQLSMATLTVMIEEGMRGSIVPKAEHVLPDDQVRSILASIAEKQQRRN